MELLCCLTRPVALSIGIREVDNVDEVRREVGGDGARALVSTTAEKVPAARAASVVREHQSTIFEGAERASEGVAGRCHAWAQRDDILRWEFADLHR